MKAYDFSLVLVLAVFSFAAKAQTINFKDHGTLVKQISLQDLEKIVHSRQVTIMDANELDTVTYEGYPVNELFEKIYGGRWKETDEILFTCLDGYQPSVPKKNFEDNEAYFAVKRVKSAEFTIENKHEGGKRIKVGPFYLVWKNYIHKGDEATWPYQVSTVDLVSFSEKFPRLAPPEKSSVKVRRGFLAFRNNCVACHSLNGDGGTGGPELNYPVNITEYYKEDWLKKWIGDPRSIRFKTGMPGLDKDIAGRDAVIDDIIAYFKAMAKNKIKPQIQEAK